MTDPIQIAKLEGLRTALLIARSYADIFPEEPSAVLIEVQIVGEIRRVITGSPEPFLHSNLAVEHWLRHE